MLDYVDLWVKFRIGNAVLRAFRRKTVKFFPAGHFFSMLWTKCLSKCPYSNKSPLVWKIPGCAPLLYPFSWKFLFVSRTFFVSWKFLFDSSILQLFVSSIYITTTLPEANKKDSQRNIKNVYSNNAHCLHAFNNRIVWKIWRSITNHPGLGDTDHSRWLSTTQKYNPI